MKQIAFVTTNIDKFTKTQIHLKPFGVELSQVLFDMQEVQSEHGDEVVKDKLRQAYGYFQKPLIVNDDSWSIPALRGFPSTNMKQCNSYLQAEDWLRLMHGVEDRTIFLIAHYAYHDGTTMHLRTKKDEMYFLSTKKGNHPKAPCLEVIARVGSTKSIAQEITEGLQVQSHHKQFWEDFAKLLLA